MSGMTGSAKKESVRKGLNAPENPVSVIAAWRDFKLSLTVSSGLSDKRPAIGSATD